MTLWYILNAFRSRTESAFRKFLNNYVTVFCIIRTNLVFDSSFKTIGGRYVTYRSLLGMGASKSYGHTYVWQILKSRPLYDSVVLCTGHDLGVVVSSCIVRSGLARCCRLWPYTSVRLSMSSGHLAALTVCFSGGANASNIHCEYKH